MMTFADHIAAVDPELAATLKEWAHNEAVEQTKQLNNAVCFICKRAWTPENAEYAPHMKFKGLCKPCYSGIQFYKREVEGVGDDG